MSLPAATGCEEDSDEEDDERNSVTHSEMDTDTVSVAVGYCIYQW